MSYEYIQVEERGRTTIVTIDRIDAHNALNSAAHLQLAKAFDAFSADDDQWVAIITGVGAKAFCAGHDLKQQAAGGGMDTPPSGFGGLASRFDMTKPVIAAVNGVAMGGGFEIVLACDIVVAASHAVFALPETRVGLAALAGGLFRLPRAIGTNRAMDLLLTGRRVSAQEAHTLGIVNEIAEEDVLATAMKWADMLTACSPMSLRATKDAVRRGATMTVQQALVDQWDWPQMATMLASDDAKEGPLAFSEKRTPNWRNR
jgi:enoyl-CoA hydratase/carnithine racemase